MKAKERIGLGLLVVALFSRSPVVVMLGQFLVPQLPREIQWNYDNAESPEFISRHSMEWKFLYVDQK